MFITHHTFHTILKHFGNWFCISLVSASVVIGWLFCCEGWGCIKEEL